MKHAADEADDALAPEMLQRLERFGRLLTLWNPRINLVSANDLTRLWPRHICDSLQLARQVPPDAAIIDLGSGAGFPGLILAIRTGNPVTLIESDTRKAAFLREAARETATRVTILNARIEDATPAPASIVTARALAPVPKLLQWAAPLLLPSGSCLFLKGKSVEDELTEAGTRWHMTIKRTPSRTDPDGVILALSHIRRIGVHAGSPDA